jgi:hypothetical protein
MHNKATNLNSRSLLTAALISAAATLFILLIHTDIFFSSMITLQHNSSTHEVFESEYLAIALDYHKQVADFAKRPVTTYVVEHFSKLTHLSVGDSFVCINFFLLFLNGILLYVLSVRHFTTHKNALFNVFIYYSSYAIFFSFFIPVYSYDEPFQYFFIFLSLIFYFEKRVGLFILTAFFALLTRETSILIFAGLAFYHYKTRGLDVRLVFQFLFPLALYGVYLGWFFGTHQFLIDDLQTDSGSRLQALHNNFADEAYAIESIFALVNTAIVPLFFLYHARKYWVLDRNTSLWLRSFIIVFVLNVLITYLMTQAREARLFNLPLILFYPYAYLILDEVTDLLNGMRFNILLRNWKFWSLCVVVLCGCSILSLRLFKTTLGVDSDNLFNEYSFAAFGLVCLFVVLKYFKRRMLKN